MGTRKPKSTRPVKRLSGRKQYLVVAVIVCIALIVWYALPGRRRAPVGAACETNDACRSGICLPDADPAEVDKFTEIIEAYELGREAEPGLAGRIDELIEKMPGASLTLRPVYPGVCTERCKQDADCPDGMFCAAAVRVGALRKMDMGRLRICMPDEHPAARLMR